MCCILHLPGKQRFASSFARQSNVKLICKWSALLRWTSCWLCEKMQLQSNASFSSHSYCPGLWRVLPHKNYTTPSRFPGHTSGSVWVAFESVCRFGTTNVSRDFTAGPNFVPEVAFVDSRDSCASLDNDLSEVVFWKRSFKKQCSLWENFTQSECLF